MVSLFRGRDARRDAVKHLLRIRANYGLDGDTKAPHSLVKTAESGCQVLAEHLYQKSTHFLLELIQNADDNTYAVDTPTLHFTYTKGYLRVDCNEVGFQAKDIDALCNLGQSSKAGTGKVTDFVGEKGIGFKSVFKVADQVWISSQYYQFKFDKTARLGMVAPILEEFPATRREGWSSFYLKLAPGSEEGVREELLSPRGIYAELLLFLRRLQNITVSVQSQDGHSTTTRTFHRENAAIAGKEARHLYRNGQKLGTYLFMRHTARGLPIEERRAGVRESEVVLAFPLDDQNHPRIEPQPVCAYLPIREYGFSFLIQADFLLIASREDVDNSSAWNQALRAACTIAFGDSVRWFNNTKFKFVWPRYLPSRSGPSDFFTPLKTQILEHISQSEVMSDLNGTLRRPRDLTYVPRSYRDKSGQPLTTMASRASAYLSSDYSSDDYKYLKRLGVSRMDHELFLRHLLPITSSAQDLTSRATEWHSRLCAALVDVYESSSSGDFSFSQTHSDDDDSDNEYNVKDSLKRERKAGNPVLSAKAVVESLRIIPLRDGRWVAGRTSHVFFPGNSEAWEVPGGLGLLVVEANACYDSRRANFYRLVGVKDFNPMDVSRVIVETHASPNFNPETVTRADLVTQAKFLYLAGWRNENEKASFWLATEADTRARGEVLYIDDELEPLSATHTLSKKRDEFEFIHTDYRNAFHDDSPTYKIWLTWLRYHMRVSNIPRICRILRRDDGVDAVEIAPELEYMINTYGAIATLNLICSHWVRYYRWILLSPTNAGSQEELDDDQTVVDVSDEVPQTALRTRISALKVPCTDGSVTRLENTFLPLKNVPAEAEECVSFISLNDPDKPQWLHLRHFGVGVKQDLDFYLRCLENIGQGPGLLEKVTLLYEQLQARGSEDKAKLKSFFGRSGEKPREMVYIPISADDTDEPSGIWTSIGQCLWEGPRCLRSYFCLSKCYPSCQKLFVDILGIGDASIRELVLEATQFEDQDDISYMRRVCFEIEMCLEDDDTQVKEVSGLAHGRIWPVTHAAGRPEDFGKTFETLMTSQSEFFIADRVPLLLSFHGLVPLVAYDIDDVVQMKRLIHGLNMDDRCLSRAVESLPRTHGRVQFDQKLTDWFQTRYKFISRLVQPSKIDPNRRKRVLASLRNLEVFSAEHIVQCYRVKLGSDFINGRERPGKVVLTPTDDAFKIYLKDGYLQRVRNPYELVDQLAEWTGIDEYIDGVWLLHIILTEDSLDRIASILDERGVPSRFDDEETDDGWRNKKRHRTVDPLPHVGTDVLCIITAARFINMFGIIGDYPDDGTTPPFWIEGANPWANLSGFRLVAGNYSAGGGTFGPPQPEYNEALEFKGEQFFSRELAKVLGTKYDPTIHWTSPLRTKAGHQPYTGPAESCSFTVNDAGCGAVWTAAVAGAGYPEARRWLSRAPTWHIQVKTVAKLEDEFVLSAAHFEVARRHNIAYESRDGRIPANAMMLVIVFDTDGETKFNMFPDPWTLYEQRLLWLRPTSNFVGKLAIRA